MRIDQQRRKFLVTSGSFTAALVISACGGGGSSSQPVSATQSLVSLPAIISQPPGQTASIGGTASFSVVAVGDSLVYQWQRDGVDIIGATSSVYATAPVAQADSGAVFTVVVANVAGSVTSDQATLLVSSQATTVDSTVITADSVSVSADEV